LLNTQNIKLYKHNKNYIVRIRTFSNQTRHENRSNKTWHQVDKI